MVTPRTSRVALVTGGNRGIGLETARELAKRGLAVVIGARDPKAGAAAVKELAREGLEIESVELAVDDPASIDRALAEIESRHARIDVLVNNAGIFADGSTKASEVGAELLESTFRTNLFGPWRLAAAVAKGMKARRYGRIVNLTSGLGTFASLAQGGYPTYGASKAALNAMTVLFAAELHGSNVLVNAAGPGWVRTRMGGSGAPRSVEQGADTPVWLATLPDDGPTGLMFEDRKRVEW